jgi:hypothetical protein
MVNPAFDRGSLDFPAPPLRLISLRNTSSTDPWLQGAHCSGAPMVSKSQTVLTKFDAGRDRYVDGPDHISPT